MIPLKLGTIARALGVSCPAGQADVVVKRVITDSRSVQAGDLFLAIRGPRFDGHAFVKQAIDAGATATVCDDRDAAGDGVSSVGPRLLVPDTIEALGALASYYRAQVISERTVVVAVTGSNGKTTTKAMIDHLLGESLQGTASPKSFNNHIGVPLTLLGADAGDRYLVAEIGSNAPGEIASLASMAKPDVAVITSIGEAHLEGLESIAGVAAEKASLLHFVAPTGLSVVNVDRCEIEPHLSAHLPGRLVTFGWSSRARLPIAKVTGTIAATSFELEDRFKVELPMPGLHHATNAAAAFAVARWFGLDPRQIVERLKTFVPPEGRTRRHQLDGMVMIDDSYNANPASVIAAVRTLSGVACNRRVLFLGDMLELGEHALDEHVRVLREVARARIDLLVLVGATMREAWLDTKTKAPTMRVESFENAAEASSGALSILESGDAIWVKASRAMQLDRVVDAVRHGFAPKAAVA